MLVSASKVSKDSRLEFHTFVHPLSSPTLSQSQAARASDYSIGEFKILRSLLFFHGREAYRRNSKVVCYNFFKNSILVLPQFFYSFYNNFSGQTLYDSYAYQLFNLFFTSLPIIIFAVKRSTLTFSSRFYHPSPPPPGVRL